MRFFNTEGPIRPDDDHYHVPPLDRVDLDELLGLVRDKRYFVLHAPRQTGKTSALLARRDLLNAGGDHRCVYANVEAGQAMREDVAEGMRAVLSELALEASVTLGRPTTLTCPSLRASPSSLHIPSRLLCTVAPQQVGCRVLYHCLQLGSMTPCLMEAIVARS